MSPKAKTIAAFIDENVLDDKSSQDIQDCINRLEDIGANDQTEQCEWLCYHLDLGDWFVDALIENNVNLIECLNNSKARIELEEKEASEFAAEVHQDLRMAQGAAA